MAKVSSFYHKYQAFVALPFRRQPAEWSAKTGLTSLGPKSIINSNTFGGVLMLKKSLLLFLMVVTFATFSQAVMRGFESSKESLIKVGDSVVVPEGADIKSAVSVGGSVTVLGHVSEDVVSVGGSVFVKESGAVEGSVVSVGGKVIKETGAVVKGDVVEVGMAGVGPAVGFFTKGGMFKGLFLLSFVAFLGFVVLVVILVSLFTPQLGRISGFMEGDLTKNLLYGILIAILFFPILLLLIISIVGIVLIPVWAIIFAAAAIFGYIAAGHLLGKKALIAAKISGQSMLVETITGVVLLSIASLIPFLGGLIKCLAAAIGLGGVYLTRFGTR
jgi:hypothetical protein